jgi:polar amino acid transport system substrate-binding protein
MKYYWFFLGVPLIFLSLAQAEKIKIAADPWCPFTCGAGSGKPGLLIEVMSESLAPEFQIDYIEMAWDKAIGDVRTGKFSAIAGALKEDAPDFVFPKNSVGKQLSCFFVSSSSRIEYKSPVSLRGLKLGFVKDYNYGEEIDEFISSVGLRSPYLTMVSGTDTTMQMLEKLHDQKIDVMVEENSVVNYVIANSKNPSRLAVKQLGCSKPQPLYIAFSPAQKEKSDRLIKKFEAGVESLIKTGRLSEIAKKYGLTEF